MTLTLVGLVIVGAVGAVTQASGPPKPTSSSTPSTPELPPYNGAGLTLLRFGCHKLVIDRIDPLGNPGPIPSPHQHQVGGGVAFRASMPLSHISSRAT